MSTNIQRLPEGHQDPDYANVRITEADAKSLKHRHRVGGQWEENAGLQLEFLKSQGLLPEHLFLDVGCGALRAGRLLVDYLEPGHYYGSDISHDLLEAGYEHELTDEQRIRLPESNLRSTGLFNNDFGVAFDMAISQSIFTHIPLNKMRLCLYRTAQVMKPGGRYFVTFQEAPPNHPLDKRLRNKHHGDANPYWYYRRDMRWVAERSPWEFTYIGDFGHLRGQRMVMYTRLPDGASPTATQGSPQPTLAGRIKRRLRGR